MTVVAGGSGSIASRAGLVKLVYDFVTSQAPAICAYNLRTEVTCHLLNFFDFRLLDAAALQKIVRHLDAALHAYKQQGGRPLPPAYVPLPR